ncbi:MAG: NB-ARC domain-containing protein [Ktedonobacteraceae bacterium]
MGRKDKEVPLENIAALQLGARMRQARQAKGISLTLLAQRLGYTKSHLSAVENGIGRPSQVLVERYEQELGLEVGELTGGQNEGVTKGTRLSSSPAPVIRIVRGHEAEQERIPTSIPSQISHPQHVDLGEAPHIAEFYGRADDQSLLQHWIIDEKCRVVSILGLGGIGKTALASRITGQIQDTFDYVFWRSLQNTPQIETILEKCILFLSDQQRVDLPEDVNEQILTLIEYLREYRCLIILDNVESILQIGEGSGQYKENYEIFGRLLELVGEMQHQSCLLLTSREKPKEIAHLERNAGPVRSRELPGLEHIEGREILKNEGLYGSENDWVAFNKLYSGNPMALKLASEPIRELFDGNIAEFLKEEEVVIGDIHDLLDHQFFRLSGGEQEIMYWLAIEREPASLETLQDTIIHPLSKAGVFASLKTLRRRFMIDTVSTALFTLQPAIMEYVTDRYVEAIFKEIETGVLNLFCRHALIKAQAKDYIRSSQVKLILDPLKDRLLATYGVEGSAKKLKDLLVALRNGHGSISEYAAGNILNLLIAAKCDLRGTDFSFLTVKQAYLQNVHLPEVNFSHANLSSSVFSDTFGGILSVKYSPDGQLLAAGTADGEIRLWLASDGTPLQTLRGHGDWIRAVTFSPDGTLLASVGDDQAVRLWVVESSQCLKVFEGHQGRVYSVAFSPDGRLIASGSEDKTIRIWDVQSQKCLDVLKGHDSRVWSVRFSPDGRLLASGSEDTTIRLWEISNGEMLKVLRGHSRRVWTVRFSPDGKTLASGSDDRTIRLWDSGTGNTISILGGHSRRVCEVTFSPTGLFLASASEDKTVRIWDIATGHNLNTLQGHTSRVRSVNYSPDGKTIVSGSEDQTVRIWEVNNGQNLKTLQGHSEWVYSVSYSPDGRTIAAANDDSFIRLWDIQSGTNIREQKGHADSVRAVAYSPDGTLLASCSEDQTVRLWSVSNGQCMQILRGHSDFIYSLAFSPDGRFLVSGSEDRSVCLWEVATGQLYKRLVGHTDWVRSVAVNLNGTIVASGGEDGTVRLWDVDSGECRKILQGHTSRVWSVAFSPNSAEHIIASTGDDWAIRLWDVDSGECRKILQGHTSRVRSVAFSPNSAEHIIASTGDDRTVRLWNVDSGKCLKIMRGHTNRICSITFSRNGKTTATGSHDGTIKIWDVQTGDCLKTLCNDKPYKDMNITQINGLTPAQKATLKELGAIENI